ncbi:MAG TPA: LAGLIDADG family homing endonuclease [Nitrososphaeraceae archaeon]
MLKAESIEVIRQIGFDISTSKLAKKLKVDEKTIRNYKKRLFNYHVRKIKDFIRTKRALEFNSHLTEEDKSYIAGFIDGEGSIFISCTKRKSKWLDYSPMLCITNSNKEVLEWIKKMLDRGVITKSSTRKNIKWKTCYSYIKNGVGLLPILNLIIPYLKVKKKQAELLRQFILLRLEREWGSKFYSKEEIDIYTELKKLNKRGQNHD